MLSQMKLAGCFNSLAGLILGNFKDCGDTDEIIRIAGDVFNDDKIPIIAGLEVGHAKRNLAIPIGLNATVNTEQKLLIFHEPATTVY